MPREFKLKIDTANAAFSDGYEGHELARLLREVADKAEAGRTEGTLSDANGARVGDWEITGDRYDDKTIVGYAVVNSEGDRVESRVHEDYTDARRERDSFEESDLTDEAEDLGKDPAAYIESCRLNGTDRRYSVMAIDEDDELHAPDSVTTLGDRKSVAA